MLEKISSSLSFKIILLLNSFLILPAIIILIFFNTKVTKSIATEIEKSLVAVTNEKLDKLDEKLDHLEDKAQSLAKQPFIEDFFTELNSGRPADQNKLRRIASLLESEFQKGNGIYENLLFNYNQLPIVDGIGGKSARVKLKNEQVLGRVMVSPSTGRPVMVNFIPVYGKAMFIMAIELNNVTSQIIANKRDNQMKSIIINTDGMVIASSNSEQIMKYNLAESGRDTASFFKTIRAKNSGTSVVTLEQQKYLAAFAKDPTRPFYFISYTPISQYTKVSNQLVFGILVLLLICIITGFFTSRYMAQRLIKRPIQSLITATEKMARGNCEVQVGVKSRDEIGVLANSFNTMVANIREGARAAERIAAGDLNVKLPVRSDDDLLNKNLNGMIANIKSVVADINMLASGASSGKLSVRAEEAKHSGEFQKIISGINRTLEAIIAPLNDGIQVLQKMAVNDYTVQMESKKYQGMLRQFAEEINTVRTRLLGVQNIFVKISNGNIEHSHDLDNMKRQSENDQLTPAGIATMQNLKNLIDEVERLSKSAINGDLQARGEATRFTGGYQQIILGLNQILDTILAPINEAATVLQEMAKGNLNIQMTGEYHGDHAQLAHAVNHTIISFNEMMGEINTVAKEVAAGAGQISSASQNLSQASTEQAATVEEINASVNEIAQQTKENAGNAEQANGLSLTTKENALNGNARMAEMLAAMKDINESSTTISKVIAVIEEIAFQTNILALNAAVEAARAGQYGQGFAVVAEEVRNLAARSAAAANETTVMIEASLKKVENGGKIASETAAALNKIVESVDQTASLINRITTASKEQATGIIQISQGVNQVSEVTQTSTATAEESAAASQELNAQAEMLKDLVGRFKLKNRKSGWASQHNTTTTPALTPPQQPDQLNETNFEKY
jgi:methyl-accepting chemotaxis protein